ncbi:MAG: response regulator, partial [Nocardioidaceae bacterium]
GSTFTLYLPASYPGDAIATGLPAGLDRSHGSDGLAGRGAGGTQATPAVAIASPVEDDERDIGREDRVLLVALTRLPLRRAAVDLGRSRGFKVLTTDRPDEAVAAAKRHQPAGIVVGMDLRVDSGTSLLRAFKNDPETRHVPTIAVHSSRAADDVHGGRHAGALRIVEEPVTPESLATALDDLGAYIERKGRSLLVVSGGTVEGTSAVVALFGAFPDVELQVVSTVGEAAAALDSRRFDCVVVDLKLAGGSGLDVIKRMRSRKVLQGIPVVFSAGDDLSGRDESRLRRYAESMVVKYPSSTDRLIDDVALFLHRSDVEVPAHQVHIADVRGSDFSFPGKRILIVDDDARNVFALASALEGHGIDVVYADNGEAGIQTLQRDPDIDLVLMDVMMPGMDGYTAMREIRRIPAFSDLPVIALTAKAMPGDRENSLDAGASDYVTKPVDVDDLLVRFRTWWT